MNNEIHSIFQRCQCCLSVAQDSIYYKSLNAEYFWMGAKEIYSNMLLNVFNISVLANNTHSICEVCIQKLRDASMFKNQVLESQTALQTVKIEINDSKILQDSEGETLEGPPDIDEGENCTKIEITVDIKTEQETTESQLDDRKLTTGNTNTEENNRRSKRDKWKREKCLKINTWKLLKNSNACPFKWLRNKYKCFCCRMAFSDFYSLRLHTAEHEGREIKNVITRYNDVLFHKVETSSLTCKLCSETGFNLKTFKEHLTHRHNVTFDIEGELLLPYNLDNKFECGICNENFVGFHILNIHMNKHYRNHVCETCGACFVSKSNLREHVVRHSVKAYVCSECKSEFANKYQKDQHDALFHNSVKAKRVCPHCPERFEGHYKRLIHMIAAHGLQRPEYKCSACDRVFLRQYLLNSHVRKIHMKEKNHQCEMCPIKFFNKYDLNQHVVTHTGEKKHVCSFCGKSYMRKSSLKDHLKTYHNSST